LKKILLSLGLLLLLLTSFPIAAVAEEAVIIENAVMLATVTVVPRPASSPDSGGGGTGGEASAHSPKSNDGRVEVTVPSGTVVRNSSGSAIPRYRVSVNDYPNPPSPPADSNIIGLAYDFQPAGATFSPPITLTFVYDPSSLPKDTSKSNLTLAFFNTATGEWVLLESIVNSESGTITALVSHFTVFAVLAVQSVTEPVPAPVAPTTPPAQPLPPVAELAPEPVPTVTLEPASPVAPALPTPIAPAPLVEPATSMWLWLVIGLGGLVILAGIFVFYGYFRKRGRISS